MAPHNLAHIKGLVPSFEITSGTTRPLFTAGSRWSDFLEALSTIRPSRVETVILGTATSLSSPIVPAIHLDTHAGIATATTFAHPAIATSTTLAHAAIATTMAPSHTFSNTIAPTFNPLPETTLPSLVPPSLFTYLVPPLDPFAFIFFFALICASVFTLAILAIYLSKICKHCFGTVKTRFGGRRGYEGLVGDEEVEEEEEEKEKGWLEKVREKMIGRRRRWEDWERHLQGGDGELSEEEVRLVWLRR